MKIILCRSQFAGPISGAEETTVTYALELKRSGHHPSVLLMFPHPGQSQYVSPLTNAGVPVTHVASPKTFNALNLVRGYARRFFRNKHNPRLALHKYSEITAHRIANRYLQQCREIFEQCRADVIHVLGSDLAAPVIIAAAHAARVPVLYHDLGTPFFPLAFMPYHQRLLEKIPLCSRVAALSPQLVMLCDERYRPHQRAALLPIMVRDLRVNPRPRRLESGSVSFGFAARIEAIKGVHILVAAFAGVVDEHPNTHLKIIGAGSECDAVEKQAKLLGIESSLHLSGAYTNEQQKRNALSTIDVLVHPSFTEGTPNCIAEAMSLGIPIIATAVGGIPDMVGPDAGILVPPGDSLALSQAMKRLSADPELRSRLGEAARARYEKLFMPSVVMPLMLNLYRGIIADAQGENPTEAGYIRSQRDKHATNKLAAV